MFVRKPIEHTLQSVASDEKSGGCSWRIGAPVWVQMLIVAVVAVATEGVLVLDGNAPVYP